MNQFALPLNAQQDFLTGTGPRKPARIDQKLNAPIPMNLTFRDESGKTVRLQDYFTGDRPVIINLAYYNCPMLCGVVIDGLLASVSNLKFKMREDYTILTISFDPEDTPEMAAKKKAQYVKRYGRPGAANGWHFLVGDEKSIEALTSAVGFRYFYDDQISQFAHGSGIIVATPRGRVSRYFYGIQFPARDLRLGLVEASENKIGTLADEILLLCFHYDPATGKYSAYAMNIVRGGALMTVAGIGGFIVLMRRKEKRMKDEG